MFGRSQGPPDHTYRDRMYNEKLFMGWLYEWWRGVHYSDYMHEELIDHVTA